MKSTPATMAAIPIPIATIRESKTNPRRTFGKEALQELTESVKKHGVLQPILVRPLRENGTLELVAGARRFRAAKAAGLTEIPATVRELTDVEVLEIQVIENLQREDLHPMEEAEGYRILQEKHGYTVEDLAAKVGKSKAYVYGRMRLTALAPVPRKLFYEGKLEVSHAFLIARIPDAALQAEAAQEIADTAWERMTVAAARELIEREYMMRLQEAPFDPKDATLVPAAGPCASCPKRTGNNPDLFGDVKAADLCTDTKCFAAKRQARIDRVVAEAAERGEEILSGKKAARLANGRGLVDLDQTSHECGWKKWRAGLGKLAGDLPVTRAIVNDRLVEYVPKKAAVAVLRKAGKIAKGTVSRASAVSERERKRQLAKKVAIECLRDIAAKGEALNDAKGLTRFVAEHLLTGRAAPLKMVAKRRETPAIERHYGSGVGAAAKKLLDGMSEAELRGLVVELIAADGLEWMSGAGGTFPPSFVRACKLVGVNHQARHRAAVKAASAKKSAKGKAKAKAKARKKRDRKAAPR